MIIDEKLFDSFLNIKKSQKKYEDSQMEMFLTKKRRTTKFIRITHGVRSASAHLPPQCFGRRYMPNVNVQYYKIDFYSLGYFIDYTYTIL